MSKEKKIKNRKKSTYQVQSKDKSTNFIERCMFIFAYIFLPIIIILFMYFFVRGILINYMSTIKTDNFEILNSSNAIDNVIAPFFSSLFLSMSLVISYILLTKIINRRFMQEKYIKFAKKSLKFIELGIILLGVTAMVYNKSEEFPYTSTQAFKEYIAEKESLVYIKYTLVDDEGNTIAVSDEPSASEETSIDSNGMYSTNEGFLYNIMMYLSQFFHSTSIYFSVFVTIAGAIIIPLKSYTAEEKDKSKNICDLE